MCFAGPTFSAELSPSSQYISRAWNTDDGLPHNSAQVIFQTQNGYLWIGTKEGMFRFDGINFVNFEDAAWPGLDGQSFTAICETSRGEFWFGTENWGLGNLHRGKVFQYAETNGFNYGAVRAICETPDGSIWIGSNEGLIRFRQGNFQRFTEKVGLASSMVRSFYQEPDGTLWIATGPLSRPDRRCVS